jgi:hypothetical protein
MADFVENFFNNYSSTASPAGTYVNKVYLGPQKVPGYTTQSPTGGTYTVKPSTKDLTETTAQAQARYLTDAQLREKWNTALRKNGFGTDPLQARALWELSVAGASDWYATSNGQQKITPEQYLGWYSSGKKKKGPALPSRQVYQVTEDEIDADIDEILQRRAGRTLQDTDRSEDWYNDLVSGINKLYSKGIVTTVEKVKNPKTGKMETVTTQTPEFSKEEITKRITSAVEEADPLSVQRKQDLDFANWAFGKMGGGR